MNGVEHHSFDESDVTIAVNDKLIRGTLALPERAVALVVFAHGSGSSRLSPRNRFVARVLNEAGLATLLVDLLEEKEASDRTLVFDIPLLAARLRAAAGWLAARPQTARLHLGYFGASTGAGAALLAAGHDPNSVKAIVSRGGRPDLAGDVLGQVTAPTLLIVGGNDQAVIELNRRAYTELVCPRRLDIIPGATHLFAEPGALEQVATLAREWFLQHLTPPAP